SDIVLNPVFPEKEIERKKNLIKGSLRQNEEDPSFLAERAFKKEVLGEHPYGRLIRGSAEAIEKIWREDVVGFHKRYYLPNNSILSVAGDLTEDEMNSLIKRYLGEWKEGEVPLRTATEVDGGKIKKVVKIDKDITQANIILGHIGIGRDNPDYYAISVINYILGGGGFSSRLMQSVRDEMGLAYSIHSSFMSNKERGAFHIKVQTKNESAEVVIAEILRQMKRIREENVSDEELSDAKSYLTGSFPRRLDTNAKIANFLVNVEFYSLGLDYVEKYPGYINLVTKEDVLRVAQKYLDPQRYVLVVVGNQEKAKIKD
ncbi:MAG: insulinase family protein, partial [Nitrospira sp.]|nr:insulinase family protein [Nitrospira sp.]